MSLTEAFSDADRRERVIDACCVLVDQEVSKKKGVSGFTIKAGYKMVKGIKPGFVKTVVAGLFDDWIANLDPIWQEAVDAGASPVEQLSAQSSRVAEALLSVTDTKGEQSSKKTVRKMYKKMRPSAKTHVEQAVPALAQLLAEHAGR